MLDLPTDAADGPVVTFVFQAISWRLARVLVDYQLVSVLDFVPKGDFLFEFHNIGDLLEFLNPSLIDLILKKGSICIFLVK